MDRGEKKGKKGEAGGKEEVHLQRGGRLNGGKGTGE